jgi:uncharacterized membrane protein
MDEAEAPCQRSAGDAWGGIHASVQQHKFDPADGKRASMTDWLDIALWIVQFALAAIFLLAGALHAFRVETAKKQLPWARDLPKSVVVIDGLLEVVGAVGLIVPRLTNVLPWLTPVAAAGLAAIMIIGAALHARRKEYSAVGMTTFLFLLAAFVAFGRWFLVP